MWHISTKFRCFWPPYFGVKIPTVFGVQQALKTRCYMWHDKHANFGVKFPPLFLQCALIISKEFSWYWWRNAYTYWEHAISIILLIRACSLLIMHTVEELSLQMMMMWMSTQLKASLCGGDIYVNIGRGSSIVLMHNYCIGNTAELKAAVLFIIIIWICKFMKNSGSTGFFYAYQVNAFIRCEFINNVATISEGVALYGQVCKVKIIYTVYIHSIRV